MVQLSIRPWLWRYTLRFWPPSRPYIEFRLTTMYGYSQPHDSMDLIRFLYWVRAFDKELKRRRRAQ